jgi:hypothetical protein
VKLNDLYEDYCSACGGWDREQQGRGHNLGCPRGEPGTPIAGPEEEPEVEDEYAVVEGRFDLSDIEEVYTHIKGYSGTIVKYQRVSLAPAAVDEADVWIMFDNIGDAKLFYDNMERLPRKIMNFVMGPTSLKDVFGPKGGTTWKNWGRVAAHEIVHNYVTGRKDAAFVREFDLS